MSTIKDVAERAGVSIATVSRVLSGKPHVRPALRQRVLEVAEELGYQPNRVARNFRAQRSTIIGLIISDIQNPFFTSVVRAVEDTAYRQGYSLFLCNSDEDLAKERLYLDLMRAERVAGVIISPTHETQTSCDSLLSVNIPVVAIDRRTEVTPIDAVLLDNVGGARALIEHLIEDGHRRIGAITNPTSSTTGRERLVGYREALEAHGLSPAPELIRSVFPNEEMGTKAADELLSLPDPPTAIFAANNLLTAGALKAIYQRNLTIPDQVALVGFDEMRWSSLIKPALTVVAQPTYELGRVAAELLLRRMNGDTHPPQEIRIAPALIVRESCGDHSPKSKGGATP